MQRKVHADCRHYVGDRPCGPHKQHGVLCDNCPHYDPVKNRVLIIKLGATGDVLRTTAVLPSVKELYPESHVTWICGAPSAPLIKNNPLVDRMIPLSNEALLILNHEEFDLCVNFDLDPSATALESLARANERKGYKRTSTGEVLAYNPAGDRWLEMSLWDNVKKANRLTYQSHMRAILDAADVNHPIMTPLLSEMTRRMEAFAREAGIPAGNPVIGFNVGAGDRWQHKKWTVEGYVELAKMLHHERQASLLILYGPDDEKRAEEVMDALTVPFIDGGKHESILEFIALLDLCDAVVTGDTFALHAALGLGKRVVCLVGPTSAQELELYGQGVILQGDIDCLGCYLTRCDKDPFCMKLLPAEAVFHALKEQLDHDTSRIAS